MTNNRYDRLINMGYSTREVEEVIEAESPESWQTHYANAMAFIVESINDDHFLKDIEELDYETMMEFADMHNFTEETLKKCIENFRKAAFREVTGTR